jgi:superfamily I DNA/RNA helicase
MLDYDDLLLYWAQVSDAERGAEIGGLVDHVLVDEYQHTNALQAAILLDSVLARREEGLKLWPQAVLFRASAHSARLELELTRRNIPFVKYGGLKLFEAAHVKDVLALLRRAENPRDRIAGCAIQRRVRACRRSYRSHRAWVCCRSGGSREHGRRGGDARADLERRVRACRRSYRNHRAWVRCRSGGSREPPPSAPPARQAWRGCRRPLRLSAA